MLAKLLEFRFDLISEGQPFMVADRRLILELAAMAMILGLIAKLIAPAVKTDDKKSTDNVK